MLDPLTTDIQTDEIVQPETAYRSYPQHRVVETTETLCNLGGEVVGFIEGEMHHDPVLSFDRPEAALLDIRDALRAGDLTGPGVTAYLVTDDGLWGLAFVEDWYEECIPYQKLHFSRGDPSCISYIRAQTEQERDRLSEYDLMRVLDEYVDHEAALWGQMRLLYADPLVYHNTFDRTEEGNPDHDPALAPDKTPATDR